MSTYKSPKELKNLLLSEAEEVIRSVVSAAKDGSEVNPGYDPIAQRLVWDAVIPMIQNLSEKDKLIAKNTDDILQLLADGDITVQEAKDLVFMVNMINNPTGTPEEGEGVSKLIIEIEDGKNKD